MNANFDILDYLNDMYMNKIIPSIDVNNAGGHYNRYGNGNDAQEEIAENNKKRINIPNAKIEYFQLGFEQDVEEYNESTEDQSSGDESAGEDGTGYNEVFSKGTQEGSIGGGYSENIVKISEKNPTKKLISAQKNGTSPEVITI